MTTRKLHFPLLLLLCAALMSLLSAMDGSANGDKETKLRTRLPDNDPPVIVISSPVHGDTVYREEITLSGSVTDDAVLDSITVKVNSAKRVPLPLGDDGSFAVPIVLRRGKNKIRVKAKDTSGKKTKEKLRVYLSKGGPPVVIDTPRDGDVIHAGTVDVRGTFEDPVTSIRHNGGGMRVAPGQFTIEALSLPVGEPKEITVLGLDDEGNEYSASVEVSSSSSAEPLSLSVDVKEGVVPLAVTFSLTNNTPEIVSSWEIDFDGRGEFVPAPGGIDGLPHTYAQEGVFAPTVRAHTAEGHTFSGYTFVSAYARAELLDSITVNDPVDLEVDGEGRVYILERGRCRVLVANADLNLLGTFGSCGTGPGRFLGASGLGLDGEGNVYVSDANGDRVQVFSPDFEYSNSWGTPGDGPGEMGRVLGMDVERDGRVLLADAGTNAVNEYRSDGTFTGGGAAEGLNQPRDVAWMGGDCFAVSQSGSGKVEIRATGSSAPRPWLVPLPAFGRPSGIAYDRHNGWLLVADEEKRRVTVVMAENREGVVVRNIDSLVGDSSGLSRPVAVARGKSPVEDIYYIADPGRWRVVKVGLPKDAEATPDVVWGGVRAALAEGDIDAALTYIVPQMRERYRDLFTSAGNQLAQIVQDMGEIYPLSVKGHEATYGILRYDDGKPFLFEVLFVRDGGGEWKILQW